MFKRFVFALVTLLIAAPALAQGTPPCVVFTQGGTPVPCAPVYTVDPATGIYVPAGGGTYTGPVAAQLPATLGPKTGANSLSVVPNTDTPFPVSSATLATAANQTTMLAVMSGTGTSAQNVQGAAAATSTTAINPLLGGGRYNSTPPTYTTGQLAELQTGSRGSLNVSLLTADSATPIVSGTPSDGGGSGAGLNVRAFGLLFNGSTYDRARGDTNGAWFISKGGSTLATGQISVTTSATLIAAARTGRQKITVSVGAANTCAFGNTGVTSGTGFPLQPVAGATLTLDTNAALYGVCSATTTVSFIELF